ncbi:MAG: META domain-containing protein [Treponema sp.]|jgi:heat shock protein HslJ|nr:META domain-containing protein [Treponema sp.]
MRKAFKRLIPVLVAGIISACAGGAAPRDDLTSPNRADITDIRGPEWQLVEFKTASEHVLFDRNKLESEGFGDIFTLRFNSGELEGKAAPNRYAGPYQLGDGQALTIGNVAGGSQGVFEPVKIKEIEYFGYLGKVRRWAFNQGRLELYSADAGGGEAVLTYAAGN